MRIDTRAVVGCRVRKRYLGCPRALAQRATEAIEELTLERAGQNSVNSVVRQVRRCSALRGVAHAKKPAG